MSRQNSPRGSTIASTKRLCPVCMLPSVVHEKCNCCAQQWYVCHGCGLALTRVA